MTRPAAGSTAGCRLGVTGTYFSQARATWTLLTTGPARAHTRFTGTITPSPANPAT